MVFSRTKISYCQNGFHQWKRGNEIVSKDAVVEIDPRDDDSMKFEVKDPHMEGSGDDSDKDMEAKETRSPVCFGLWRWGYAK